MIWTLISVPDTCSMNLCLVMTTKKTHPPLSWFRQTLHFLLSLGQGNAATAKLLSYARMINNGDRYFLYNTHTQKKSISRKLNLHYDLGDAFFCATYFPYFFNTESSDEISHSCNFPLEPPIASKKGQSSEKDTEKTAPAFGFLDVIQEG